MSGCKIAAFFLLCAVALSCFPLRTPVDQARLTAVHFFFSWPKIVDTDLCFFIHINNRGMFGGAFISGLLKTEC